MNYLENINGFLSIASHIYMGRHSAVGIATGYGLGSPRSESRCGSRFSSPVQTGPGVHPASCTMYIRSFPRVKSGRSVTLTSHALLVPWSSNSRAIPLLLLWAVGPVQRLSACTRVHFTLQGCNLPFYFSHIYVPIRPILL
jgi:hypothetical protein